MKLETMLGFKTGGLVCIMMVSALTANIRTNDTDRMSTEVASERTPVMLALRDARMAAAQSVQSLESMLLVTQEGAGSAFRAQRAEQMAAAEQTLAGLQKSRRVESPMEGERLRQAVSSLEEMKATEETVERLAGTNTPEAAAQGRAQLHGEILPLEERIFGLISELSDEQRALAETELLQLQAANHMTVVLIWLISALGSLVAGSISFVVARRLGQSIDQLASRADSIAGGDLTGGEVKQGGADQVRRLAEAMSRMQTSLGGIIGTVADTAGSLTGSAASMRSASDQIHRRIDQQSQQTQQAATAMQEMSASIAEVSRHTHSAAETARAAAQTARDGGVIVKEMLGSMHTIATAVTETSATVGLLGEDSRRISQIVTVIDEIARKTNLLALNAAIEAARAGEQGRGFAVVAGEVRRLAESTAQATGEIATMIGEIQDRTRTAIASMSAGTGTVEQGVVTTTQAGEALERIIGMAERVDRMITQIAIAASQQATAADKSSASLDSIHSLSHENLTEMATTAAGIENLRGTAVRLEEEVDRFHLQAHPGMKVARAA